MDNILENLRQHIGKEFLLFIMKKKLQSSRITLTCVELKQRITCTMIIATSEEVHVHAMSGNGMSVPIGKFSYIQNINRMHRHHRLKQLINPL